MWDVVLFYKYTPIDNVPEMVATHEALATRLGLSGRLLIAVRVTVVHTDTFSNAALTFSRLDSPKA